MKSLKLLFVLSASLIAASCATPNYSAFRVDPQTNFISIRNLPDLLPEPVLEVVGANVYLSNPNAETAYIVPAKFTLAKSVDGSYQAINLEQDDGERLILVSTLVPNIESYQEIQVFIKENYPKVSSVKFYPFKKLEIKSQSDSKNIDVMKFTAVASESDLLPNSILIAIQVFEKENILSFKSQISQNHGLLIRGVTEISFRNIDDASELKIHEIIGIIQNTHTTSMTM